MRYLLLIYTNEVADAQATPAEQETMYQEYNVFGETAKDYLRGGEALLPTSSATTVRVREGQPVITDGPFAETKEQLGGYYVVESENLDDAIAIAAKIPGAKVGSIEVRPVMVFN